MRAIVTPDWGKELDRLRSRLLLNDSGLAIELGLSRSMLSQVRIGHRSLPTKTKLLLLGKLGYPLTRRTILACLSDDVKEAILIKWEEDAQVIGYRRACLEFLELGFDRLDGQQRGRFFAGLCCIGGCRLDALLQLLGVEEAEFSEIVECQRTLNFLAKSAIYECFCPRKLALMVSGWDVAMI